MDLAERHRKFTVEDFYRMAEAGILREDDRVELLDGEIIEMSPIGSRHAACVDRLTRALSQRLGDRALLRVQGPVRLSSRDEPEPDLAVLRPKKDFYAGDHPGPADVLLVIEVADTTLDYDAGKKTATYARAGVPEVWIVDLSAGEILVRRDATGAAYRTERTRRRGERVAVAELPGVELAVDDILPD